MSNSITPPPELVTSLRNSAPHGIRDAGVTRELWLINHAYTAGADQELEACCREVQTLYSGGSRLRARRRPRPLTRKERALKALDGLVLPEDAFETICFALEALPND